MDGAMDRMKGKAKEAVGKVTDDEEREREGKLDQAKGNAKDALDRAGDAVRDATRD